MIRLGIIGAGGMGNHHGRVIAKMEGVRITGVCDIIADRARKLAEELGAGPCTDFRDLLADVDAVWVCTPPYARTEIVTTCARAGKDIFAEKPIALNLSEADEMISAAAEAKVKFMLGYVLRFTYPYTLLRGALAGGQLGELVACWTRRHMHFLPRDVWYGRQEQSGGVALDFGSHDIDWLRWCGGEARVVFGRMQRCHPEIDADMHGQTVIVFDQGVGTADVCWSSPLMESSVGVVGTEGSLIVDRSGTVRRRMMGREEEVLSTEGAMGIDPAGKIGKTVEGSDDIEAGAAKSQTITDGHRPRRPRRTPDRPRRAGVLPDRQGR